MRIEDLVGMEREVEFPIFPCAYNVNDAKALRGYEPGKIILSHYRMKDGFVFPSIIEDSQEGDIVFVPLYGGPGSTVLPDRWLAHDTSLKLPEYENNISIIKELAPRVKGILVGNAGPEMSFKEKWDPSLPHKTMSEWMCEFVKETSDIIGEAGGTPVYGTVDWDIAIDCYFGDGMLKDLANNIGAIQICFCGFQLFNIRLNGHSKSVPSPSDQVFWIKCPKNESSPWPELTSYLRETNQIWSGVDTIIGLSRGFDITLKEHGFDAGVMGPFEENFSDLLSRRKRSKMNEEIVSEG